MKSFKSRLHSAELYLTTATDMKLKMLIYRALLRGLGKFTIFLPKSLASNIALKYGARLRKSNSLASFIPFEITINKTSIANCDLDKGIISGVGVTKEILTVDGVDNWRCSSEPLLYRFYINYFEWVYDLERSYSTMKRNDIFVEYFNSWCKNSEFLTKVVWSPYVVSLRAVVFADILNRWELDDSIKVRLEESITKSFSFLKVFMERDVEGNHLIKNVKALIVIGSYFGNGKVLEKEVKILKKTVKEQILNDGAHYERSVSYHIQVLIDLIDIRSALNSFNSQTSSKFDLSWLDITIEDMSNWLSKMQTRNGIYMVNDSFPVEDGVVEGLVNSNIRQSKNMRADKTLETQGDAKKIKKSSGYLVFDNTLGLKVLFDVGDPCPKELPAHVHADTFNILFSFNDLDVFCDTSTSTYEIGEARQYERSTKAHNTVEVDSRNSTEVWGAFRAGRKANVTDLSISNKSQLIEIVASHDGYMHLPGSPVHKRKLIVSRLTNKIEVIDQIKGSGTHKVDANFHMDSLIKVANNSKDVNTETVNTELGNTGQGNTQFNIAALRNLKEDKNPKNSNNVEIYECEFYAKVPCPRWSSTSPSPNMKESTDTLDAKKKVLSEYSFRCTVECDKALDVRFNSGIDIPNYLAKDFGKVVQGSLLSWTFNGELPIKVKVTIDNFKEEKINNI